MYFIDLCKSVALVYSHQVQILYQGLRKAHPFQPFLLFHFTEIKLSKQLKHIIPDLYIVVRPC